MASDGGAEGRMHGRKPMESGFHWVSSSPSPAEVESLEAAYPEIVNIPLADLEEEMDGWRSSALIARSYQRWVPAEAIIRELRRAGVQGEIVPVSLAFRCHILRFEDPKACELVLNRPWSVNGQVVGTERWKPEFFPAENAIKSVLLWVRLPNLPMEFWKEDFIRAILEPAGEFICVDAATSARSRGGFARACLRVDISRPLRPGSRVQGVFIPFWQQIAYENLDGICSGCGTLHLEGRCAQSAGSGEVRAEDGPVFGPWMAALRQRRGGAGSRPGGVWKSQSSAPQGRDGGGGMPTRMVPVPGSDGGAEEGWSTPVKVARRRGLAGEKGVLKSSNGSGGSGTAMEQSKKETRGVPGLRGRAVFPSTENVLLQPVKIQNRELGLNFSVRTVNPFDSLDQVSGEGGQLEIKEANPGPLKRARPVACQAPRVIPKAEKRKGKGKALQSISSGVCNFSSEIIIPPSFSLEGGLEGKTSCPDKEAGTSMEVTDGDMTGLIFGSMTAVQSPRARCEGDESIDEVGVIEEDGNSSFGCTTDSVMIEDQGGVQDSSCL